MTKSTLLFIFMLHISALAIDGGLDTNNLCKYNICKANDDSVFHKYDPTLFAKSRFDSLIHLFRLKVRTKDSSLKNLNKLSGGLFVQANNHLTYPIIRRMNEVIEDYCTGNNIDIFILYPPYSIKYANGESDDFPVPLDSLYVNKLRECTVAEVTDELIGLLNKDPETINIRNTIEKEYIIYRSKINAKIDQLIK